VLLLLLYGEDVITYQTKHIQLFDVTFCWDDLDRKLLTSVHFWLSRGLALNTLFVN